MAKGRKTYTLDADVIDGVEKHAAAHRMSESGMVNWLLARTLGLIGDMQIRPDTDPKGAGDE